MHIRVTIAFYDNVERIETIFRTESAFEFDPYNMEAKTNPLEGYEKIRTVGKGAFGVAVLYKKKCTDALVVLKEVNTIDLTPAEFEMAMNEVEVLSSLSHPNIIGYGGSFVVDGVLMIEMEYADGGTLSQTLSNKSDRIPEREILALLRQITSAIAYMHENNVLHRDLKTANVFMNLDGCVKIGDFGIAKVLNTNAQAQTILGTPYYISPEMCEGKEYDEKSDMWAVGCILYEMCCLHKTFQASSLSALVNTIMMGKYKPIPLGYSRKLKDLIGALLNKNPNERPTAEEVCDEWIPDILSALSDKGYDYVDPEKLGIEPKTCERTVLYHYRESENGVTIEPIRLPPKVNIINVSIGKTHYVAVTEEGEVFVWGSGDKGQLGLGETINSVSSPTQIDSIYNKQITMCKAGRDFTVLLTNEGEIFTCGSGSNGALGHGDWNNSYKPKLIVSLIGTRMKSISCSPNHVGAISIDGEMYTWGNGLKGQTGQSSFQNCCTPKSVEIRSRYEVVRLELGFDASMAITADGKLFACGWNDRNKLSVHTRETFPRFQPGSEFVDHFKKVHCVPKRVVACDIGKSHCNILVKLSNGVAAIYTTGSLLRDERSKGGIAYPYRITTMDDLGVTAFKCQDSYTVFVSDDNCLLFWGLKRKRRTEKDEIVSHAKNANRKGEKFATEFINEPTPILGLYASPIQVAKKSIVTLIDVYPIECDLFVLVKSTVPLKRLEDEENGALQTSDGFDSLAHLPAWMKNDLMKSEFSWNGHNRTKY